MKRYDVLREYIRRLNDDDLKFLCGRLTQRLGGDVGEAASFIQQNQDMDHWFSTAASANDFFDMIDQVDILAQQEARKRFSGYEKEKRK